MSTFVSVSDLSLNIFNNYTANNTYEFYLQMTLNGGKKLYKKFEIIYFDAGSLLTPNQILINKIAASFNFAPRFPSVIKPVTV